MRERESDITFRPRSHSSGGLIRNGGERGVGRMFVRSCQMIYDSTWRWCAWALARVHNSPHALTHTKWRRFAIRFASNSFAEVSSVREHISPNGRQSNVDEQTIFVNYCFGILYNNPPQSDVTACTLLGRASRWAFVGDGMSPCACNWRPYMTVI